MIALNSVVHGDCMDVLPRIADNVFAACVTDPPYGLNWMNLAWDRAVPPPAVWREVMRVLRPGAFLVAFGGGKTYHRVAWSIEEAGFEVQDVAAWLFGQGRPATPNRLKPGLDLACVARKPLEGTETENLEKWGVGVLDTAAVLTPEGRHPANVHLDEEAAALLDAQSGTLRTGAQKSVRRANRSGFSGPLPEVSTYECEENTGGASRFFYVSRPRGDARIGNHPTAKPPALMERFVRMATPRGGPVLDPFCGGGSTLHGSRDAGRPFLGIEREAAYVGAASAGLGASPQVSVVEGARWVETATGREVIVEDVRLPGELGGPGWVVTVASDEDGSFGYAEFLEKHTPAPPERRGIRPSVLMRAQFLAKAHSLCGRLLEHLRVNGPATDEQMQDTLDMNPSTQRPRRIELVQAGLVENSGVSAKTRSGRSAALWRAVEVTP